MHTLAWIGLVLLLLGLLVWFVFEVTLYLAAALFIAGLVLIIWGVVKARQTLTDSTR